MNYTVAIVGDNELPAGMHKVIVERIDGPPLMLINGEIAECWRFLRAFEDTQESRSIPTVLLPAEPGPLLYAV